MRVPYIHGSKDKVNLGKNISLMNTILNVSSGNIEIGSNTIFGHNCVLATGVHEFKEGMRKKIYFKKNYNKDVTEAPTFGHDIKIGQGCWIASNVTIIGGVTIGDNVIIAAGSVVVKDIPSSVVVAGVPGKIIKSLNSDSFLNKK
jgi:acetyltransferase-like isoleucine patch superfamily enzyme